MEVDDGKIGRWGRILPDESGFGNRPSYDFIGAATVKLIFKEAQSQDITKSK